MQPEQRMSESPALAAVVARLQRRLWIERGIFTLVLLALAAVWLYPTLFPGVWAIYVQGRPVVAMRDRAAVQAVVDRVKEEYSDTPSVAKFGSIVRIGHANPSTVTITDEQSAVERLEDAWRQHMDQALIYIDGTAAVALPTEEEAKTVLERVKADLSAAVGELQVAPTFSEQVEIRVEPTTEDISADVETAVALLEGKDTTGSGVHRVGPGENGWSIAGKYELRLEELKKLNPGVNLNRLRVGQELRVSAAAEPLVTVVAEGQITREEPISFDTELRSSPEMYLGKRLLIREGKPGKARVTYRVKCENGKITEREELARTVIAPPQTKVVVLGIKSRPVANAVKRTGQRATGPLPHTPPRRRRR